MTNAEKYVKEIVAIARDGNIVAIEKETGIPCACESLVCPECQLYSVDDLRQGCTCHYRRAQWFNEQSG